MRSAFLQTTFDVPSICYDRRMKHIFVLAGLAAGLVVCAAFPSIAQTQAAPGAIEFEARVRPTGGQPEPVRQISFYALRRSLGDIRAEAQGSVPPETMEQFIDGTEGSPALKAWMKKNHTVDFAGTAFTKQITTDDIVGVPEFREAYKLQNASALQEAVPESKPKPGENADKVARAKQQYETALRHFIITHPESVQGLDAEFIDKNPYVAWTRVLAQEQQRLARRMLELAQSKYMAGEATADLNGRGAIAGLAPGTYWLSTLDTPALAGDVRLEWDYAVTVHPGETVHAELSNVNAVDLADNTAP
jgi:hypothetical protein